MESIAKISRRCVPGRVLGTSEAHIGVGETGSCTALKSVFSIFQLAFDLFRIIMIDSESVCLNLDIEIERNLRSNMQIPTRCSTFHGLVFGHKRTGLDLFIDIDPHAGPHSRIGVWLSRRWRGGQDRPGCCSLPPTTNATPVCHWRPRHQHSSAAKKRRTRLLRR